MANVLEIIGLKAVLEGVSGYLSNLDKMGKAEKAVGDEAEKAEKKTKDMGSALTKMSLAGTTAFVGLGAMAVKFAMGFENQMSQVGAILQANDQDMEKLGETAKKLGADTAFSANDAAKAMEELAAGGRSVAQIIGGEAAAATSLAAAGNYGLADSARTIATTMDVWKRSQIDTNDVVNRLAGAANASRFGVEDMSQAIASGGGVAAQAGVNFQDFSTVIAATASSFNSGSDAGTSFKTFVTSLTGNSEKAKDMIKQLGLEFYNAQGQLKPMSEIVQQLNEKLSGLSQEQQTVALKTIFGNDAFRTAAGLMNMTGDEFTAMSNKMRDTNAADVATQRMDNLNGSLEQLKGSAETLAIATGERVIPTLTLLAQGATIAVNAFTALPESTQNMILGFSAIAVALPVFISGIGKAAKAIEILNTAMHTGKGKAAAFAAGIGLVTVATDILLQQTTGHGLMERIFGDVAKADASAKAIRNWDATVTAAGPKADKLKLAFGEMGTLLGEMAVKTDEVTHKQGGFQNAMLGSDDRIFGFKVGLSGASDKVKEFEARVETLGAAMRDGGAEAFALKNVYDQLPPSLQDNFDKTTNVVAIYKEFAESAQMGGDRIEAMARAGIIPATEAAKALAEAVPNSTEAIDKWTERVAVAEDGTQDFKESIDALHDSFAATNPIVIALNAQSAKLNEELEDIKDKGDAATDSDKARAKVIEKELLPAIDKEIKAYADNQKGMEGMSGAVQALLGERGYNALLSQMRELDVASEDQVAVQGMLAGVYQSLATKDLPGAITGFGDLKKALSPEVWAIIAQAVGPAMINAIANGVGSPAEKAKLIAELDATLNGAISAGKVIAQAESQEIGFSIAQGLIYGLNASANKIQEAAVAAGKHAIDGLAAGAEVKSPSKAAIIIGKFIAEGLAIGIEAGAASATQRAVMMTDSLMEAIHQQVAEGTEMTKDEMFGLMDGLSDVIQNAGLEQDVQASLYLTMQGFVEGINNGKGLANAALIDFIDTLKGTIAANPITVSGPGTGLLGTDGKWYPNEGAMPSGVGGASSGTDFTGTPYEGMDQNAIVTNGNSAYYGMTAAQAYAAQQAAANKKAGDAGPDGTVWDPNAIGLNGKPQPSYVYPWTASFNQPKSADLGYGYNGPQPAMASTMGAGTGGRSVSNTTAVTVDMRGAQLTGTMAENETMIYKIVTAALKDVAGRDAFLSGVKV